MPWACILLGGKVRARRANAVPQVIHRSIVHSDMLIRVALGHFCSCSRMQVSRFC
jgi:hypothetical protein